MGHLVGSRVSERGNAAEKPWSYGGVDGTFPNIIFQNPNFPHARSRHYEHLLWYIIVVVARLSIDAKLDSQVFINRRPGLRLKSVRWKGFTKMAGTGGLIRFFYTISSSPRASPAPAPFNPSTSPQRALDLLGLPPRGAPRLPL
jgi:hypothetical protein